MAGTTGPAAPTATVSVPATSGLGIPVTWTGQDDLSGIRSYEVEVKEAGGAWTQWLTETTATQGTFIGTIGMTYTFQVRAIDNVDNVSGWVESDEVVVYSVKKYYAFGGSKVAMRQGDVVYYLSGDHLGSTSLTTDENGDIVSEVRYLPYGEERWTSGATPTDFTFTGQRNEVGFGLMDYNARYYNPRVGRFVSPDTVVPEPGSSGGFNRYRYTRNNPLKYTDPSGHCIPGLCPGQNIDHYNTLMENSRGVDRYEAAVALNAALADAPDREPWNTDSLRSAIANDAHLVEMNEGLNANDTKTHWDNFLQDAAVAGIPMGVAAATGTGDNYLGFGGNRSDNAGIPSIDAVNNVHGNSRASTKPQNGYEIFEKSSGDVVKTGISGQPLNKNGTSARANGQVNALNRRDGAGTYDARIVVRDTPGRAAALDWERNNARRLFDEGHSMNEHRRPGR